MYTLLDRDTFSDLTIRPPSHPSIVVLMQPDQNTKIEGGSPRDLWESQRTSLGTRSNAALRSTKAIDK